MDAFCFKNNESPCIMSVSLLLYDVPYKERNRNQTCACVWFAPGERYNESKLYIVSYNWVSLPCISV